MGEDGGRLIMFGLFGLCWVWFWWMGGGVFWFRMCGYCDNGWGNGGWGSWDLLSGGYGWRVEEVDRLWSVGCGGCIGEGLCYEGGWMGCWKG